MRNPGRVLERDVIIAAIWDRAESVEDGTLKAFISLLRQKVDRKGEVRLIQTVRGIGYRVGGSGK